MASRPTKPRAMSDAVLDAQIARAKERHQDLRDAGQIATEARYNAESHRVDITLSSGLLVGIPIDRIRELKGASHELLAAVHVDELGAGIRWDALDVDVAVPGIIIEVLGEDVLSSAFAARGGRASSDAKAAAARANGLKGGRPRLKQKDESGRFVVKNRANDLRISGQASNVIRSADAAVHGMQSSRVFKSAASSNKRKKR